MAKTRRLIPMLLIGMVAACSVPETQLRNGLVREGVPQPVARCMAARMADRLSLNQMRRLASVGRTQGPHGVGELLHRLRALNDPEIVDVTATSAALCAIGLPR